MCSCDGGCPLCKERESQGTGMKDLESAIHPKLKVSQPNDPLEREADMIAEQVMNMSTDSKSGSSLSITTQNVNKVKRKCNTCEEKKRRLKDEEQELKINRKASAGVNKDHVSNESLIHSSSFLGIGVPLDISTKEFMESRFEYDFSSVRIHDDSGAINSAELLNASAYTVDNHIYFGPGMYKPNTLEGKRLIAHELTHIVQQQPVPQSPNQSDLNINLPNSRQLTLRTGSRYPRSTVFRQVKKRGLPGTSILVDEAKNVSQAGKKWKGSVERKEFVGEEERTKGIYFSRGWARLEYDEDSCTINVPLNVNFVNDKDHTVSDAVFSRVSRRYIEIVNEALNNWYSLRIEECSFPDKCAEKDIPIRVLVKKVDSNADYTVFISNQMGRSYVRIGNPSDPAGTSPDEPNVVMLYAQGVYGEGLDIYTIKHEGAHMVLGSNDEYKERFPGNNPNSYPVERERQEDFSMLGSIHVYKDWALLHERHFNFVAVFMKEVLSQGLDPGCVVKLKEIKRPTEGIFRLSSVLEGGFANILGGGKGGYFGMGLQLGIPVNRVRSLQFLLGGQLRAIGDQNQQAFLYGMRMGFEKLSTSLKGGKSIGIFGEVGGASGVGIGSATGYSEIGFSLGLRRQMESDLSSINFEGAIGSTLNLNDPEKLKWVRFGLSLSLRIKGL